MAVKEVTYHKQIQTPENLGPLDYEDIILKQEIENKFSLEVYKNVREEIAYRGSDGNQDYVFRFNGQDHIGGETSHQMKVHIRKSGNSATLSEICDLEKFLLEHQFEKIESGNSE